MPFDAEPPTLSPTSTMEEVYNWAITTGRFIPQIIPADAIDATLNIVRKIVPPTTSVLDPMAVVALVALTESLCDETTELDQFRLFDILHEFCQLPPEIRELIEFNTSPPSFRLLAEIDETKLGNGIAYLLKPRQP